LPYQFPAAPSSATASPERSTRVSTAPATFDQILAAHALEDAATKDKEKEKEKGKLTKGKAANRGK
jgi:hypothetical protein